MTERKTHHSTFVIERSYPAAPSRVFRAFADRETKARWFVGPDEWQSSDHTLDFRIGGTEHVSGGPPGGPVHHYDAVYQDIVPDERIITTYVMHMDTTRISVSVATLEFKPSGSGTRLVITEQGAYLDGFDKPEERERGTKELLDNLGKSLEGEAVKA